MKGQRMMRWLRWLPLLIAVLGVGSCSKKTPTLNLLVWEGYADPSFVQAFEEQNHCKISASYMGSSDELMAKLRGGSAGNYDVISPSSDVATSIATAGLAAPLDLSKIPSYSELSPQLTSLALVRAKGEVYGVPFMWGPDPIIYDTTAFAQPPDSWRAGNSKMSHWVEVAIARSRGIMPQNFVACATPSCVANCSRRLRSGPSPISQYSLSGKRA